MNCPSCKSILSSKKKLKAHLKKQSIKPSSFKKAYQKYGYFKRTSDGRVISRYLCLLCRKTYSSASDDPAYYHKKRRINHRLKMLLASNMSMRRSAQILGVSRTTIDRKLRFLGKVCREENEAYMLQFQDSVEDIQFDELQTIEHTKCKPLAVMVAVSGRSRKILSVAVSSMPATGHLAKISRKKYGFRPDCRVDGLKSVLKQIRKYTRKTTRFHSDKQPFYSAILNRFYPQNKHIVSKGDQATISGQGELKKRARDPLFFINHTLAMLRANINRLIRRTWCTTKKVDRLRDHLAIYMSIHNQLLTT